MVVVIVIILLVVTLVGVHELLITPPPPIQVDNVYMWAPDGACGLDSTPNQNGGFNSSTSAVVTLVLVVPNFNSTACTIKGISTNTTGFALGAVRVPVTISGHGNATVNLTVTSPSSSFTGNLNLVFS